MTWIANAFLLIGLFLVGGKSRAAFVWTFLGETLWLSCSVVRQQWDIAFICAVFAGFAAVNWWRWGRDMKREDQ